MKKAVIVGLVSAALAGCGGSDSSDSNGTGTFSLAFSDAPVDGLDRVCVAFDQISVHHANGGESSWGTTSFAADQSSPECVPPGLTIPSDSNGNPEFMVINLMAYQGNDSLQVLSDELMESGKYTQMRLSVLEKGTYSNGTPYSHVEETDTNSVEGIRVPSGELKLDGFDVVADATQAYTLEFDLRKSMVQNANGYQLKPRGVRLVNNESVAAIDGTVSSSACNDYINNINDAFVYVYPASTDDHGDLGSEFEPYTSVAVNVNPLTQNGTFDVGYVPFGTYDLALVCNGSEDHPEIGGDQLEIADPIQQDLILSTTGLTVSF
ncbi:DUF4382 domain-containing protein [Photobacterium profundum]|uniref:DUF4382 domain-containing protein n=1 Tax=Photobacterium profundum 3TCK TaxID=314280 RepID=Q1Z321_9GAMM|nr:DUF4382 domain-containing protein [Photobacterium profundum]EAS42968.1 hypothetical protein P3TCK_14173 [Photobacterium profundum 3TCK]